MGFKLGDLVEHKGRGYVYMGDSANGAHAILTDATCSLKLAVAHSQLKPAYIQPWHDLTEEAEALIIFATQVQQTQEG